MAWHRRARCREADCRRIDTKAHALRDEISKEEARAILLLCSRAARECGLRLALSKDEQDLMARKFDLGAR
jgi:hypothetical protein